MGLTNAQNAIQTLLRNDTQKRIFTMQVWRNGRWITVPVDSVTANLQVNSAGKMTVTITNLEDDQNRSQLYEGERIRAFRGVEGAPAIRCWTGFVDTRQPLDQATGLQRTISITDHIQELNDAIMLDGVVYDCLQPNVACIDAIDRTLSSDQWQPFDDNGNVISSTANYTTGANPIVYFPTLYNDDGSVFFLPSGTLGSFTGTTETLGFATFIVPGASGTAVAGLSYSAFELPNQYIIASTMNTPGFTLVSQTSFPPAKGTAILDSYNGIMYFNVLDASTTCSFTATYYDTPLFAFPPGTKVSDVISNVLDKTGARWHVDGAGQLKSVYIDTVVAPTTVLGKDQYVTNNVQINRDRRNVVVCLGWDGNCGGLLAAKAINIDDINNPPPIGIGKRTYLIAQDATWTTQYAVFNAVYYAILQISRRGKNATITMLDDPTVKLEDVICFESTYPEVGPGDFFYVNGIQWTWAGAGGSTQAMATVAGTMLPGQGTFYFGPITGVTQYGGLDYTQDVQPITNCYLEPDGGSYLNYFSISSGLNLVYTIGDLPITEIITIYGSDGTTVYAEYNVPRAANQTLSLPMPMSGMTPGVLYVIVLRVMDSNENCAVYRDFIFAKA